MKVYLSGRITGHTWECYLRHDLVAMLACDAVAMLDGWETSHGARLEHATAVACGMAVWYPPVSTLHASTESEKGETAS